MVNLRKRKRGTKIYYYLEHSIRKKDKVEKKWKFLGQDIPKDLEKRKLEFMRDIHQEKWYAVLDKIKKKYVQEHKTMPKTLKEKELDNFVIKFTYDTQRIEGSTLTLRETADLLEKGLTPKTKPVDDVKEAEAHKELFYDMFEYKKDLSLQVILLWHKKLLQKTKADVAGKVRKHQVGIAGSKFMPPSPVEVDVLLDEFFKWYHKHKDKIHPVELAALVHLKFVTIHPFADGNGRISRLTMNFVLHKKNFPLFSVPYNKRSSYYTALERAQVKEQEHIFVQWFVKKYIKVYRREAE
jgi:Fic family protein